MLFLEKLARHNNKWCLLWTRRSFCSCGDTHKDDKYVIGKVKVEDDFIVLKGPDNDTLNIREELIDGFELISTQEQKDLEALLKKAIQKSKLSIVKKSQPITEGQKG